ncbi:hypothetical protein OG393_17950 [Streptomyces sp. NBC_01216]|uniref:DUF7848 domain-containing protein n=1 Tax=Streptomyces sp. NBC_01216 TaxID=2903778 RepID=UPI002E11BCCA|nr:hypothetical protein OG393_17950 [Streptomyces sp. NBC_01216]
MNAGTVYRFADWTIGRDRAPGVSAPIREMECTTCLERSEPGTSQLQPDRWALAHAGTTGHTGFREIVTVFLRVTPAPGNPLHRATPA